MDPTARRILVEADDRDDLGDGRRFAAKRRHVEVCQRLRRLSQLLALSGRGIDDQDVGAEVLELGDHRTAGPLAEADHRDERRDTDCQPEHRERAARRVPEQDLHGRCR